MLDHQIELDGITDRPGFPSYSLGMRSGRDEALFLKGLQSARCYIIDHRLEM